MSPFPSDIAAKPLRGTAAGHSGMQQLMDGLLEGGRGDQFQVAQIVATRLDSGQAQGCSGELQRATDCCVENRWFRDGQSCVREPDQHQSQRSTAGSVVHLPHLNFTFGAVVFGQSSATDQTHLRSHSGGASERGRMVAGQWDFASCPRSNLAEVELTCTQQHTTAQIFL